MYQKPKITAMNEDEVLAAFQMTAAQISAAGCWWNVCNNSSCVAMNGTSGDGDPN